MSSACTCLIKYVLLPNLHLNHLLIFMTLNYLTFVFSLQSLIVRDTVRECLEKDPADRSEDDIEVLLEFMQHFPVSFSYFYI